MLKVAFASTDRTRVNQHFGAAEGFVIVHPNWWGMPPAVLVGWVDRVMRPGLA